MNRILCILIIIGSTIVCVAQKEPVIDSLQQIIKINKNDSMVAKAYLLLGEEVYQQQPDSAILLWKEACALAVKNIKKGSSKKIKVVYQEILSACFNNIGFIYDDLGDVKNSLDYYKRSLKLCEELRDKEGKARCLNNIGLVYLDLGLIDSCLAYYQRSLHIKEELDSKKGIAISLNNIGGVYSKQGEYEKCLDFYQRSLKLRLELNDKSAIASSLHNIGAVYMSLGETSNSLKYLNRSLEIRNELNNKSGIAACLMNIGR